MKRFLSINKLKKDDKVAVLSPSSAAPAVWPHVYDLGIERLKEEFGLQPVEYPTTKKKGATGKERTADLESAFADKDIKAIITTIGGNDEVTYVKNIDPSVFIANPKPFFGFSDNTHLSNFLWLNGIPSYYGGALFTQYAIEGNMDDFTKEYLRKALFEEGEFELKSSETFNDEALDWNNPSTLSQRRKYESNEGWVWNGKNFVEGITWGGCLESIDEMLRHSIEIPNLKEFENIILLTETSEEMPSSDYCFRVYRALGERGILSRVKAILNGRPQAWFFDKQLSSEEKKSFKSQQRNVILETVRKYNSSCPVVQNLDFGHTNPQIPIPYGRMMKIDSTNRKIYASF